MNRGGTDGSNCTFCFVSNKNNSPRLSIVSVRGDYRMNDPAGKAALASADVLQGG
jgi:hypothetical protein